MAGSMINASLNDTASVTMCADRNTMNGYCIEDELSISTRKTVEAFLDNMIAVKVLDHLHNVVL